MKVRLALMNAQIMLTLFFVTYGTDKLIIAQVVESSPKEVYFHKFNFPSSDPDPVSREQVNDYNVHEPHCKYCGENLGQNIQDTDPYVNSLARSNMLLITRLNKLDMKFDSIMDTKNMQENAKIHDLRDMLNKLNLLYQHITDNSNNMLGSMHSTKIGNGMNDVNLQELVAAVGLSNQNIHKLASNFEQVMESNRQSINSLGEVAKTIEDINNRNNRLEQPSSFEERRRNYSERGEGSIVSSLNSIVSAIIDGSSKKSITINNYPSTSSEQFRGIESAGSSRNPIVNTERTAIVDGREKSVAINTISSSDPLPGEEIVGSSRNSIIETENRAAPKTIKESQKKYPITMTYSNITVTHKPNMSGCDELDIKRNGIYKFRSLDEAANEAERYFSKRYCYFDENGDAWTVIQRRYHKSEENFNRNWWEYKLGFGNLVNEFWFGNDFIHNLTSGRKDGVQLRMIFADENDDIDESNSVEYSHFKIKSEKENYTLEVDGYNGTIVNNFLYNNSRFSTFDNQIGSCASSFGYGWWFKE